MGIVEDKNHRWEIIEGNLYIGSNIRNRSSFMSSYWLNNDETNIIYGS